MIEHELASSPEPVGQAERRAYVRLACDLAATCRPADRHRDVGWPGRVRDISRAGVGLLLRHRFRPGTTLAVELRAHNGTPMHTLTVRVVHATAVVDEGNPCWLLGCALEQPLSEQEFQALQ
jgi:hypothetical protein